METSTRHGWDDGRMQRVRRLVLPGLLLGVMLLLGLPSSALAHANLEASRPGAGETVGSPPGEVWTKYTEELQSGSLEVYDPCGTRVDNGDPRVVLDEMTVSVSADKAGTYSVRWRVLSVDGHTTAGDFSFTSSGGSACPGSGSSGGGGDGDGGGNGSGGNGGGGDRTGSSSSSGGGDGGNAQSSPGQQSGGGDGSTGGDARKDGKGKKKVKGGHSGHHQHGKGDKKGEGKREIELAGGPSEVPPSDPSDIPTDWLLISLAISALVGAAGGRVYVNIFGGVRRSR